MRIRTPSLLRRTPPTRAHVWQPMYGGNVGAKSARENKDPANYDGPAALQIAPVYAAVSVLASGLAASTPRVFDGWPDGDQVTDSLPRWSDPMWRPSQVQSRVDFMRHVATALLVGGNAYIQILSVRDGVPDHVTSLQPDLVMIPGNVTDYTFSYQGRVFHPYTRMTSHGDDRDVGKILHLRLITVGDRFRGVSPLVVGAPPLRAALAAESQAEMYFASGGVPPGLLVADKLKDVPKKEGDQLVAYYQEVRRRPEMAWVPLPIAGDWKWISTYLPPDQTQLLDSRKFAWSAAAALYGIPPPLLGSPDMTTWGTGLRAAQKHYREFTLAPFLDLVAWGLTEMLPVGQWLTLLPDHLLRLEPLEQARYFERLIKAGVLRRSEVRRELGLPPIAGIDDEPFPSIGYKDSGDSDSSQDDGTDPEPDDSKDS